MRGKITKRLSAVCLAIITAFSITNVTAVTAEQKSKEVEILFTHDTHSHLESFNTVIDGEEVNIGGYARIKTIIDEKRAENPDTLVLDGGDFSMGTLFQTIYKEEAAEIRMLGALGYDATTLGNHEFDYRTEGLAQMLGSAKASGDALPSLLLCNLDWSEMNDERQMLRDAFEDFGMKDYEVIEKDGVKIALLGVFGEDALACAPTCALAFENPVDSVKETVEEIKEKEAADMIICLSHCGTNPIASKSEDEMIAKEVPDVDLIISGHSHTILDEPIVYGDTAIVSAGEYGKNVGSISLTQNEKGRWAVDTYELIPTGEDIPSDEAALEKMEAFRQTIDEQYLSQFDMTAEEVLCQNAYTFSTVEDLQEIHEEHNLGDIMSDAYLYAAAHTSDSDGEEAAVAVVPSGTVRDTYVQGDVTVSDVFNSFSLGVGPDGVPGYPLIKVYLTGKELKTAAEIDASVSDYMNTARLYCSGLNMTFNPNRIILNKVTDVCLEKDGEREEIENDKLYCVIADLYSGQMLSSVTDMSFGLLSIVPKNADGSKVEDFEQCIIYDNGKEVKAWEAIAHYMQSFEQNENGVAQIPEYYNELHDRKVVDDDKNIISRVKNPNKYVAMMAGVLAAALAVIVLLVVLIVKVVRRIRKKNRKS